ncbi:MAG TPA: hypothetical protein PLN21_14395 [Gemmatales bacterium]|nr:hypothetical protein [Gemmatales bacterium]
MRRTLVGLAVVLAVAGTALGFAVEDAKYTTKQIMKAAHGGNQNSLLAKVKSGKASDEEKAKLVDLYSSMPLNKAKKGDADEYKKMGEAMVEAAKAAKSGDAGWQAKLNKATNCKACHDSYK